MPVFLPPGTYVVSNLMLPRDLRLTGVPGATRTIYGGDGYLLAAENAEHIELNGLVIDGANRRIGDHAQGLLELRGVRYLVIDNCRVTGSGKNGQALERISGRIERSEISGAADAGIVSVEAGKLRIAANAVSDCGNGRHIGASLAGRRRRHHDLRQSRRAYPRPAPAAPRKMATASMHSGQTAW
jgi:uncharacterized secreted repeat protein (TIGR03808 family)